MRLSKQSTIFFIVILIAIISAVACNHKNKDSGYEKFNEDKSKVKNGDMDKLKKDTTNSSVCDTTLWNRVYNPERLEVYDPCVTVTGVIKERHADDDGDEHMLLRLDKEFKDYVNKRNETKKDGCLVIEAVCVNKVNRKKVGNVCDGYVNNVFLPNVGDHVKVTGSYVKDTGNENNWMEIHPITKIEIIN